MTDYSFVENRIAKENIGEHDADNQINEWQHTHEDCTLIGICYEDPHPFYDGYYPMVYEDEDGNRFWTHWCVKTSHEYEEAGLLNTPLQ